MKNSKKIFNALTIAAFCFYLTAVSGCLGSEDSIPSSFNYRTLKVTVNFTSETVDENNPICIFTYSDAAFNDEVAVSIAVTEENNTTVSTTVDTSTVYVAVFYDSNDDLLPTAGEAYEIYEETSFIGGEAFSPEPVSIEPAATESISITFDNTYTFTAGDPMLQ